MGGRGCRGSRGATPELVARLADGQGAVAAAHAWATSGLGMYKPGAKPKTGTTSTAGAAAMGTGACSPCEHAMWRPGAMALPSMAMAGSCSSCCCCCRCCLRCCSSCCLCCCRLRRRCWRRPPRFLGKPRSCHTAPASEPPACGRPGRPPEDELSEPSGPMEASDSLWNTPPAIAGAGRTPSKPCLVEPVKWETAEIDFATPTALRGAAAGLPLQSLRARRPWSFPSHVSELSVRTEHTRPSSTGSALAGL
mmetsp:Transcript_109480/g.315263  ORF Transcript_109480/g.315263 Transcript_109480/m.315263 type:complete len:251 (+) Transcript_109480:794-1546(+)